MNLKKVRCNIYIEGNIIQRGHCFKVSLKSSVYRIILVRALNY